MNFGIKAEFEVVLSVFVDSIPEGPRIGEIREKDGAAVVWRLVTGK